MTVVEDAEGDKDGSDLWEGSSRIGGSGKERRVRREICQRGGGGFLRLPNDCKVYMLYSRYTLDALLA